MAEYHKHKRAEDIDWELLANIPDDDDSRLIDEDAFYNDGTEYLDDV